MCVPRRQFFLSHETKSSPLVEYIDGEVRWTDLSSLRNIVDLLKAYVNKNARKSLIHFINQNRHIVSLSNFESWINSLTIIQSWSKPMYPQIWILHPFWFRPSTLIAIIVTFDVTIDFFVLIIHVSNEAEIENRNLSIDIIFSSFLAFENVAWQLSSLSARTFLDFKT